MSKIIFGDADPRDYRRRNSPGRPNGYAARLGTGPAGETCGTCKHDSKNEMGRTYHKCGLMRHIWTGGPASDIAVRSPACARWEKKNA